MPIYGKPTKALMYEFAKDQLTPGRPFNKKEAVAWFAKHYPKIKPNTVQMHVEGMSVNSRSRKHHPTIRRGSGHDLFYKLGRGRYRLWDEKTDPAPYYPDEEEEESAAQVSAAANDPDSDLGVENGSQEFAFEEDLKNYLAKHLGALEPGLTLYEEEGITGLEYDAGGRFIDILAVDKNGTFVVIELKVSRGYERVVAQILRYMGWIKANLSDNGRVRGIIVASNITDDLKLAASQLENVRLAEYELHFKIKPVLPA